MRGLPLVAGREVIRSGGGTVGEQRAVQPGVGGLQLLGAERGGLCGNLAGGPQVSV